MYIELSFNLCFLILFVCLFVFSFKKLTKPLKSINESINLKVYYRKTHNEVLTPRDDIEEPPIFDLTALVLHKSTSTKCGHYTCKLFLYYFSFKILIIITYIF